MVVGDGAKPAFDSAVREGSWGDEAAFVGTIGEAREYLAERLTAGDTVLVKASHGTGLCELADELVRRTHEGGGCRGGDLALMLSLFVTPLFIRYLNASAVRPVHSPGRARVPPHQARHAARWAASSSSSPRVTGWIGGNLLTEPHAEHLVGARGVPHVRAGARWLPRRRIKISQGALARPERPLEDPRPGDRGHHLRRARAAVSRLGTASPRLQRHLVPEGHGASTWPFGAPPSARSCFIVWANFLITAWSNAVNLTDGLDGLATGARADLLWRLRAGEHLAAATRCAHVDERRPRTCYEVRDPRDLAILAAAIAGACVGFLWWNT